MTALTDVFVPVRPDTKNFEPDLKRRLRAINADKEGHRVGKGFSKSLGAGMHAGIGGPLKSVAGTVLGAFAALKGIDVFKGFIADARESARLGRITAQVIKTTGGAAKISATQVGNLAQAISNKTGADDGAIQSGENLLLTFTNIRNATGKNNDIFNQATKASVDLAAAMNNGEVSASGLKSSSIQLGKALNDPIKGVTALSKVGVSFTEQQKDQIKAMVEAGDTLGAQKVILAEVNKEFGGAAAAAADPLQKLKTIAGGLGESVGTLLLPMVDKFARFLSDKAVPGIYALVGAFQEGDVTSDGFVGKMEQIGAAARGVFDFFKAEVLPRLKEFAGFLGTSVIPKLVSLAKFVGKNRDFFIPFAATIVTIIAAVKTWIAVQTALNFVLSANPIGLVVLAIAALAGGLVYAYKHSEKFRAVVDTSFKAVSASAKFMWNNVLKPTFRFVADTFLGMAGVIVHGAATAFGWVPGIGPKLKGAAREFDKFRDKVNNALDGIHDENVDISARFFNHLPKTLYGVRVGGGAGSSRGGITAAMATGGPVRGPGSGTSDDIPAMLSNNEHVWTSAEVNAAGGHGAVEAMRRSVLRGYANGGAVLTNLRDSTNKAMGRGANELANVAAKAIAKSLTFGGAFNPGLIGGLNFAKAQAGKPYIWGGVGPRGYDCSGFMSAILNVVQGRSPYSRRFSTGTFPAAGFIPGPGAFMIGSRRGFPGHMAGTINGVNVESSGSVGAHFGRGARGARDSMFTGLYHLRGYARGGRVVDGDPPFDLLDRNGQAFAGGVLAKAILGGEQLLDSGGWIPPGRSIVNNQTGRPEWVPPPGSSGATYNITINTPGLIGMTKQDLRNGLVTELEALKARRRI
jgi:hypothetical protein